MNSRQLRYLTLIALAVIAAAIWIGIARKPSLQNSEQDAKLYPALTGQLAKVQTIRISKSAGQKNELTSVELTRTSSGWSIKQRSDFPADTQKVNTLLLGLQDAKLREEKTSNPTNYATLGVQDLTTPGASGALVELTGSELTGPPVKLIVGKSDPMTHSSYLRRSGEDKSWLASELTVSPDVTAWLHRDLLNIGADRIQEVLVQISDSPQYSVVKEKRADANFDVTPLPKKRELNSVSAANSVSQVLTNLELDDVRPLAELTDKKSVALTSVHTFDGLIIDISGYKLDDKHWIVVKASFDDSLAKRFHLVTATKDSKADTMEAANDKIRAEADLLNKQLGQWAFAVAPYKYDAIFKPVEELLKKPEVKK
jgi:hypothetical protein